MGLPRAVFNFQSGRKGPEKPSCHLRFVFFLTGTRRDCPGSRGMFTRSARQGLRADRFPKNGRLDERIPHSSSFAIEFAFSQLREQPVGILLFLKGLPKKGNGIVHSELFGPGDKGAVARNLIVFN